VLLNVNIISDENRQRLWSHFIDPDYNKLTLKPLKNEEFDIDPEDEIILLDVRRTYPNSVHFPKDTLIHILRNIRLVFMPEICYYQGLNYLVAYLMTKIDDENIVFRLACSIIKN
jgi:Rab-GTPase-TBC domain